MSYCRRELVPTSQKSYYGKAEVEMYADGVDALYSYDTLICWYYLESGTFVKIWNGYSKTTMKHINDFRKLYGLPTLTKKEWESL